MFGRRHHGPTAAAAILYLLAALQGRASTTVTSTSAVSSQKSASHGSSPQAVCPSKSLNYITHTLPQQCFTNSWADRPPSSQNGTETPTAVATSSESIRELAFPEPSVEAKERGGPPASTEVQGADPISGDGIPAKVTLTTSSSSGVDTTESFVIQSSKSPSESETDSPLDNANFLSFEEWKKQNLAKAGQSAENLGAKSEGRNEQRRRPAAINNALDSLGEDTEIDFDFGGFVSQGPMQNAPPLKGSQVKEVDSPDDFASLKEQASKEESAHRRRPKDAGRTCKERTNYASYDCAATTLKTNAECKSSSAILVENKDTYMLNMCSAQNKFFIVELCDNILIDTVVLANFEFFSSMFRTLRVSVSDKYPVRLDKWREIGTYEARNGREVQAFLVENPLIWARYVRVEMLTHYGNEYYCPVSLLRVHGTTMMEEFNSELKGSGSDEDADNEVGEDAGRTEEIPEVVTIEVHETKIVSNTEHPPEYSKPFVAQEAASSSLKDELTSHRASDVGKPELQGFSPYSITIKGQFEKLFPLLDKLEQTCSFHDAPMSTSQSLNIAANVTRHTVLSGSEPVVMTPAKLSGVAETRSERDTTQSRNANTSASTSTSSAKPPIESIHNSIHNVTAATIVRSVNSSSSSVTKAQSSATQPPASNPTTQESFFKSVHKRLQLLEANSTLSLQYIEDQSRILRDAFSVVEKRQTAKTTSFLESLNTTVLTELLEFRKQYDQIWQSTVLELSSQREQSQHEVYALSARLTLLADEIVFQKRMAILQFMLILLCLGLVIFSKTGQSSSSYLEFRPFVQHAMNKSSANLSKYAPLFDTPPSSPSASRPSSRYGIFRGFGHRSSPSGNPFSKTDGRPPSIEYSPPTPTSQRSGSSGCEDTTKRDRPDYSNSPPEPDEDIRPRSTPTTPEVMKEERRQFLEQAFPTPGATIERQLNEESSHE